MYSYKESCMYKKLCKTFLVQSGLDENGFTCNVLDDENLLDKYKAKYGTVG